MWPPCCFSLAPPLLQRQTRCWRQVRLLQYALLQYALLQYALLQYALLQLLLLLSLHLLQLCSMLYPL